MICLHIISLLNLIKYNIFFSNLISMATQSHVTEIINALDVIYLSFTKLKDYIIFDPDNGFNSITEIWTTFEKFSLDACKKFVKSFNSDLKHLAEQKMKDKKKSVVIDTKLFNKYALALLRI